MGSQPAPWVERVDGKPTCALGRPDRLADHHHEHEREQAEYLRAPEGDLGVVTLASSLRRRLWKRGDPFRPVDLVEEPVHHEQQDDDGHRADYRS